MQTAQTSDTKSTVGLTKVRLLGICFCVVHVVLLAFFCVLGLSTTAKWGFTYAALMPTMHNFEGGVVIAGGDELYNSKAYERHVPLKNSTMQCFIDTVSTVGGVVVKHDNVFETVSNEPREKMESCFFTKVAPILDYPVSPHSVFGLGACSPYYLIIIIQFIIVSHIWWTHAPIDAIYQRRVGGMSPEDNNRHIPGQPYDLVVAIIILIGGFVFTFFAYERMKVVYSNIVMGCIALMLVGFLEIIWLLKSEGTGMSPVVSETMTSVYEKSQKFNQNLNFDLRLDNLVPKTMMPFVPKKEQGKHLGTWGFVKQGVTVLNSYNVLVIPRYIVFTWTVPVLVVCSLFIKDGLWHKEELSFIAIAVFSIYSLLIPLYILGKIISDAALEHSGTGDPYDKQRQHTVSGWLFVYLFYVLLLILTVCGQTHYLVSLGRWQEYTSVTMAVSVAALCVFTSLCVTIGMVRLSTAATDFAMVEMELRTACFSFLCLYLLLV